MAKDLVASCGELIAAAVLSAELSRSGVDNIILHGVKLGLWTAGDFGDETILHIDLQSFLKFERTHCIIIPGFQGMDENGHVMTLGEVAVT